MACRMEAVEKREFEEKLVDENKFVVERRGLENYRDGKLKSERSNVTKRTLN